jgi:hypothetical protein
MRNTCQLLREHRGLRATFSPLPPVSAAGIASPVPVFALVASLLLGACSVADSGKKEDPTFFGTAGGGNGGGGATSGMHLTW